jgi:hypothetical protein
LNHDKALIEASFAAQYGIRLRQEENISLAEFFNLLSGLCGETPLGRVVAIRMEKNPKVIKGFGRWEKKVRADWVRFASKHLYGDSYQVGHTVAEEGTTAQDVFKELFAKRKQ